MDYATVARARSHAHARILLNKKNVIPALRGSMSDGAADYAAADDQDVGPIHYQNALNRLRLRQCLLAVSLRDGVEIRGALHQPRLRAVMNGVHGFLVWFVAVAP